MKTLAISGINFYQKRISRHKGFTCAHLGLWGGISCSEAVKRIIAHRGIVGGWSEIKARFGKCRSAAAVLSESLEKPEGVSEERWKELTKRSSCKDDIFSCDPSRSARCEYGLCMGLGGD